MEKLKGELIMKEISDLYPSQDGNKNKREEIINLMNHLLSNMDQMKNEHSPLLNSKEKDRHPNYYEQITNDTVIPNIGEDYSTIVKEMTHLLDGHPYPNKNFFGNVVTTPSIASLIGTLTMCLSNGNSIWDAYGTAAAEAEIKVTAMLSELVGYNRQESLGYSTWGGQGAVFSSLRMAIARHAPNYKEEGIPNNLYCFASELSHYSLLRSIEATGIGTNHLMKVKVNEDHSMNIDDLSEKIEKVIQKGGTPLYIAATTGTTDTFGIDHMKEVKETCIHLENKYAIDPIFIHADSAMGGFYAFFNNYDFNNNPLAFSNDTLDALITIQDRLQHLHLADSVCFDFHKLGQTPYVNSFLLAKDKKDVSRLSISKEDSPYIGDRSYGNYHTSYTFECSRSGSSIVMYATLLEFGIEGYQKLLGHFLDFNLKLRSRLTSIFPNLAITNKFSPGPITTFRIYQESENWDLERKGLLTEGEINQTNDLNKKIFEYMGEVRDKILWGDTSKVCYAEAKDTGCLVPIASTKLFITSPFTTTDEIDTIVFELEQILKKARKHSEAEKGDYVLV